VINRCAKCDSRSPGFFLRWTSLQAFSSYPTKDSTKPVKVSGKDEPLDIANPEHRAHVAKVWGIAPEELPGPGVDCYEIFRRVERGEVKGLLSISFNPIVSLPDNDFIRRMLEKLEFFVAIDFFMTETSRHADVVLPGSLHEEDEGTRDTHRRSRHPHPEGDRVSRSTTRGLAHRAGHRQGPRSRARIHVRRSREIFDELRAASKGGIADYSGITYEKIEETFGIFWPCPDEGHPGTPRLFEAGSWNPIAKGTGPFYFPDGKARFVVAPYTPPTEDVDAEYPLMLDGPRRQPFSARKLVASGR
jgi:assimilatory nitrate reductase catalytic subunit